MDLFTNIAKIEYQWVNWTLFFFKIQILQKVTYFMSQMVSDVSTLMTSQCIRHELLWSSISNVFVNVTKCRIIQNSFRNSDMLVHCIALNFNENVLRITIIYFIFRIRAPESRFIYQQVTSLTQPVLDDVRQKREVAPAIVK